MVVEVVSVDNNLIGMPAEQSNQQPLFHYRGYSLDNFTVTVPLNLNATWRQIIQHWVLNFDPYNTQIQQQQPNSQQTQFQSQGYFPVADGMNSYGQYQQVTNYNNPYYQPQQPQQPQQPEQPQQPTYPTSTHRANNFSKLKKILNLVLQGVNVIDPQLGASISSAVQFGEQSPRLISLVEKVASILANGHSVTHELTNILKKGLQVGENVAGRISQIIVDELPKVTHHLERVVKKIVKKVTHAAKKAFQPRTYSHAIHRFFKHLFAEYKSQLLGSSTKVIFEKKIFGKDLKLTFDVKAYLLWDDADHFVKWEGSLLFNFLGEQRKIDVLNFNATVGNEWNYENQSPGRIGIKLPIRLDHPFSFIVLELNMDVNYTVGLNVKIEADDSGYPFKFKGNVQVTTNAVTHSAATLSLLGMKAGLFIKGQLFKLLIEPSINLDYKFDTRQIKLHLDWFYEIQKSELEWAFFWETRNWSGSWDKHDYEVRKQKTQHEVWKLFKKAFSIYV